MTWIWVVPLIVAALVVAGWICDQLPGYHLPCRICGKTTGIRRVADLCPKHDGEINE